jgi:putative modified peptide
MSDQLTSDQVSALLDKLSTDDDYRKLFVSDLGSALAQLPGRPGIPKGVVVGGCLMPAQLADKQRIIDTRKALQASLSGQDAHVPKVLEA